MKTARLQIRIDPKLKAAADRVAQRSGTTLSEMIVDLVEKRVEAAAIESRIPRKEDEEQI